MITETIELFGLPGAGKSTVARAVVEQLRKVSCTIADSGDFNRWRTPGTKRYLLLRRPGFALKTMQAAFRFTRALGNDNRLALRQAVWLTMKELYLERYKTLAQHEVLLLDEWILQNIWAMMALCPDYNGHFPKEMIDRCTMLNPRLSVFFSCDPELALQRIRMRPPGPSRFDHMSDTEARASLDRSHALAESMARYVRKCRPQSFLHLEAKEEVEQKAQAVMDFILKKRKPS